MRPPVWKSGQALDIEHLVARQFGEAALDIARRGGKIAGVEVAVITLTLNQVTLVGQHHPLKASAHFRKPWSARRVRRQPDLASLAG